MQKAGSQLRRLDPLIPPLTDCHVLSTILLQKWFKNVTALTSPPFAVGGMDAQRRIANNFSSKQVKSLPETKVQIFSQSFPSLSITSLVQLSTSLSLLASLPEQTVSMWTVHVFIACKLKPLLFLFFLSGKILRSLGETENRSKSNCWDCFCFAFENTFNLNLVLL